MCTIQPVESGDSWSSGCVNTTTSTSTLSCCQSSPCRLQGKEAEPHCKSSWKVNGHTPSFDAWWEANQKGAANRGCGHKHRETPSSAKTTRYKECQPRKRKRPPQSRSDVALDSACVSDLRCSDNTLRAFQFCSSVIFWSVFRTLSTAHVHMTCALRIGSRKCSTAIQHSYGCGAWRKWKSVSIFSRSKSPP